MSCQGYVGPRPSDVREEHVHVDSHFPLESDVCYVGLPSARLPERMATPGVCHLEAALHLQPRPCMSLLRKPPRDGAVATT